MTTTLLRSVPVLQITNAERSCEFYCGKLGFKQDWQHQFEPGLHRFVSISRGAVTLFLTEHPESASGALVYLYVEDVDGLAHELRTHGAVIDQGPTSQPWGMREIQLHDPDGNRLRLGQDIEKMKS